MFHCRLQMALAAQGSARPSPPSARWRFGVAAAFLAVLLPAQAGEIYKYTAEDGTVTYSSQKPKSGAFKRFEPTCLLSYIGCDLARSDWGRVRLNRSAYRNEIASIAARHGVDPHLVRALVHAESNFNHKAVSRAGAQGLMQLMPATQRLLGVRNPYDVSQNLEGGTRLLKKLLDKYRYDIRLAAAAYNAGEDAVARYQGIPPYDETRNYVRRVSLLYSRYQNAS